MRKEYEYEYKIVKIEEARLQETLTEKGREGFKLKECYRDEIVSGIFMYTLILEKEIELDIQR